MSRPLRIEFPGAVYHVTSRGDRREPIYRDDDDRRMHLDVLAQAMDRFDARVLAYCLMGNHYHLVLHTAQPNLSRLMRQLNGVTTQLFNRRHGLVGHLFQGRFKAILVDRDAYLLALCRYVERNPVAAGIVVSAEDWPWSSYRAHVGTAPAAPWLDVAGLHRMLLEREPRNAADRRRAAARYAALVANADLPSPWDDGLRQQLFLGDDAFVARSLAQASPAATRSREVPKAQRKLPATWASYLQRHGERDAALRAAVREGGMTMTELARETGLSVSRVSRVVAEQDRSTRAAAG
jgi:putative transposase